MLIKDYQSRGPVGTYTYDLRTTAPWVQKVVTQWLPRRQMKKDLAIVPDEPLECKTSRRGEQDGSKNLPMNCMFCVTSGSTLLCKKSNTKTLGVEFARSGRFCAKAGGESGSSSVESHVSCRASLASLFTVSLQKATSPHWIL